MICNHQQQSDRRDREGDQRHQAQQLGVDPFALQPAANQQLNEKRVFDAHAKSFARFAILRKCARQRILKTLRRAGEQHEVQQHIKMEGDENDRRENIKAQQRQV